MKLKLLSILLAALVLFACNDDDNIKGSKVNVLIKGKENITTVKSTSVVELEKFLVNISEIEFDVDELDGASEDVLDSIVDAQELNGPFLVDLVSADALKGLSLGTSLIPNAVYEEVEFEFEECTDSNNEEMFGYSVLVKGTADGTPFIIQSNKEWEMEIEFPDNSDIIADGKSLELYIEINITNIINQIKLIDFSTASDNNQNGIIEINPDNVDGNAELANIIVKALSESIELDDDDDLEDDD